MAASAQDSFIWAATDVSGTGTFSISHSDGLRALCQTADPSSPLKQQFSLTIGNDTRALDSAGFSRVAFRGEYPIGIVEYADDAVPVAVKLEAFSPFIPLNTDDSSLPATILQFTLRNTSGAPVEATLSGQLENGVCLNNRWQDGLLRNRVVREPGLTTLALLRGKVRVAARLAQPDIVFEDWDRETYEGWKVEGAAFGSGPVKKSDIPSYQGDVGGDTARVVNSHASAPGDSVGREGQRRRQADQPPVHHRTPLHLVLDWRRQGAIGLASGTDAFRGWKAGADRVRKRQQPDGAGTFRCPRVRRQNGVAGNSRRRHRRLGQRRRGQDCFHATTSPPLGRWRNCRILARWPSRCSAKPRTRPAPTRPRRSTRNCPARLAANSQLAPGESAMVTFVLAWHFPNLSLGGPLQKAGRYYATKFSSAHAVAQYVADNFDRLAGEHPAVARHLV